jgi:hypothetical protein
MQGPGLNPEQNAMDGMGFQASGKAQMDLLAMALACDLTRVASLQWRTDMVVFSWLGVNNEHHNISHQTGNAGPDAQLTKIVTWYSEQFAYLLSTLKSFSDVGGTTLLDNTLVFWPNELATGNHHLNHAPFVLASGKNTFTAANGKKLQTGRYLNYKGGTSHSGLLTVIGNMFGLPLTNFGDPMFHQGPLPNLI